MMRVSERTSGLWRLRGHNDTCSSCIRFWLLSFCSVGCDVDARRVRDVTA